MSSITTQIRNLHQMAYDYVWDRWGIYAGTFRMGIVMILFADSILITAFEVATGKYSLIAGAIFFTFLFGMIWLVFGRRHLGPEWRLQHDGKLKDLNAEGLRAQRTGTATRLVITAISALLAWHMDGGFEHAIPRTFAWLAMMSWTFSLEVLVRERDPDRFASREALPEGA